MMVTNSYHENEVPNYTSCVHNITRELRVKLEDMLQSKDLATSKMAEDILTKRNFSQETIDNTQIILDKIESGRLQIHRESKLIYFNLVSGEGTQVIEPLGHKRAYYTILFRKRDEE